MCFFFFNFEVFFGRSFSDSFVVFFFERIVSLCIFNGNCFRFSRENLCTARLCIYIQRLVDCLYFFFKFAAKDIISKNVFCFLVQNFFHIPPKLVCVTANNDNSYNIDMSHHDYGRKKSEEEKDDDEDEHDAVEEMLKKTGHCRANYIFFNYES